MNYIYQQTSWTAVWLIDLAASEVHGSAWRRQGCIVITGTMYSQWHC